MATINPSQDYDIIHTLTFSSSGGTSPIRLHRGSASVVAGTVYYRAGTSGAWTSLPVGGTGTFPITSTTMQIAHDWDKSGNNYMTPSFQGGTMTGIAISQKAALSGTMGDYFMYNYAYGCSNLITLDVPDTSGLTSVSIAFMHYYAFGCSNLTTLAIPDTSGLTSVGGNFMHFYAGNCVSLTTLDVPDTSGLTSVGAAFMYNYANGCTNLTTLAAPDTSGLTSVIGNFMAYYAHACRNLTALEVPNTSGLTSVGNNFMAYYAFGCWNLPTLAIPDTSSLTSIGNTFMAQYAYDCFSLTQLTLPKAGWFKTNNVNWSVPIGRLGVLKGYVLNGADLADWQALTVSGKTLYTNYIRSVDDVIGDNTPLNNAKFMPFFM